MPWCRIDRKYEVDCIEILPFEKRKRVHGLDDSEQRHVKKILAIYKTIQGSPVDRAALIRQRARMMKKKVMRRRKLPRRRKRVTA
jgi:hypothetical protein